MSRVNTCSSALHALSSRFLASVALHCGLLVALLMGAEMSKWWHFIDFWRILAVINVTYDARLWCYDRLVSKGYVLKQGGSDVG